MRLVQSFRELPPFLAGAVIVAVSYPASFGLGLLTALLLGKPVVRFITDWGLQLLIVYVVWSIVTCGAFMLSFGRLMAVHHPLTRRVRLIALAGGLALPLVLTIQNRFEFQYMKIEFICGWIAVALGALAAWKITRLFDSRAVERSHSANAGA